MNMNTITTFLIKYPRLESAAVTFVAFFVLDIGTSLKTLSAQPVSTITWTVLSSLVIAAGRSAIKELWVWYKTPSTN